MRHRSSRSRDLCPPLTCGSRAPRGQDQRTNPLTGIRSARRSLSHLVILVCVLLSTLWSWSGLAGDNQPPRVLIISGFGDTLPAAGVARNAIRKRLEETLHGKVEVFYDPLDFGRFPGQDYQDQITLFLAQKYAKKRPDVLIALELESLRYLLRAREVIAPGAPIVFCCMSTAAATLAIGSHWPEVTGAVSENRPSRHRSPRTDLISRAALAT